MRRRDDSKSEDQSILGKRERGGQGQEATWTKLSKSSQSCYEEKNREFLG
jgi:hypothetical protein